MELRDGPEDELSRSVYAGGESRGVGNAGHSERDREGTRGNEREREGTNDSKEVGMRIKRR